MFKPLANQIHTYKHPNKPALEMTAVLVDHSTIRYEFVDENNTMSVTHTSTPVASPLFEMEHIAILSEYFGAELVIDWAHDVYCDDELLKKMNSSKTELPLVVGELLTIKKL